MHALALVVLLAAPTSYVETLKTEAKQAEPLVKSAWVKEWLKASSTLTPVPPSKWFVDADKTRALSEAEAAKLPDAERARLKAVDITDEDYYGRYSSPIAYARAYDVLAAQGFSPKGKQLVDFGYGNIGQLKMLAAIGAKPAGIEVEPVLPRIYANEKDVRIFHGFFPSDAKLRDAVGGGWDVFMAKNTLKRGFIHPDKPVDPKRMLKLNVSDDEFAKTIAGLLNKGGWFFIYNITPAQAPPDKPFIPWADGRCPFSKETLEKAGFEVVAFDADDTGAVRALAHALHWDTGEEHIDIEHDLFGEYTLARKKM